MKTTLKRMALLASALLTTAGLSVITAPAASASAYSCTGYGWIRLPYTTVASSRWCGQTNGSGRYVSTEQGAFFTLIAGVYLCNTSMKVEFFDWRGLSEGTFYSGTRYGCLQAGGTFTVPVYRTLPSDGYVRISLLSYGAEIAAVQQNIKA